MSNSTTLLDTISTNSSNKEVVANALFDAASPAMLWGRHASACSLLTWGYYGGWYGGAQVANGSLTLTASATNYVFADGATGAVSVNATGFPAGKIPLYVVTTSSTTVTAYTDQRGGGTSTLATLADVSVSEGPGIDGYVLSYVNSAAKWQAIALAAVAKSGAYSDLSGRPTLATVATSGIYSDLTGKPAFSSKGTGTPIYDAANSTVTAIKFKSLNAGTNMSLADDGAGNLTFSSTAGGAGSTTLSGMTDVNVVEGPGIDNMALTYNNATSKWVARANVVDLISFYSGNPVANAKLLEGITPQAATFPVGLTGSYAYCDTAPTGSVTLTINKVTSAGSVTALGSINFSAGATTGTFTFSGAVTTAAGDRIQVLAPATPDVSFADVSLALVATR